MGISRDEICAQRIGLIAEMGSLEEEITVFGCCYWEQGEVKYRVSSDKDEIYRFMIESSNLSLFPTPVHELTVRQLIPAGSKDVVLHDVKRSLACRLKEQYPSEYFMRMRVFMEQDANNAAWAMLEQLRDEIEGLFEADALHLYEMILRQCCQKKLVDEKHKQQAWIWLEKNRSQMDEDIVIKEKNERTFYGILYLNADGTYAYKVNLELGRIVQEKIDLEQRGVLVGPVLRKTFWYKDSQQLSLLRGEFADWMKSLAGDRLKVILEQMRNFASPIEADSYRRMLEWAIQLPAESQYAMQWYGRIWNVSAKR